MKLVIVESPTKTKSLSKYLGDGYEVLATMGHIRDLPKSKMGIEIKLKNSKTQNYKFEPAYELSENKTETARKLQAAAKKAEKIILASDPDREGEAIAWHVAQILDENSKNQKTKNSKNQKIEDPKIERVSFHSITKEAIKEAIEHPRQIDMNLVDAQQARRVLDRIVGYELSPVLWKKVRRGLSAGRVQSVAVRLIADREKEIEAFKSEEYWEIRVKLENSKNQKLEVELVKIDGKTVEVKNETRAREIEIDLNQAEYVVEKVEKKERRIHPHPPFKTSTLQQAAANVLGWSAKKTMAVAQRLYEKGAITYHRTDSLNLVESAVETIRELIGEKFGKDCLPEKAIYYKTSGKVVAQEAHEGIRPTDISIKAEGIRQKEEVDKDEEKLYELIWRRTVACQMVPAVVDQTKILIKTQKLLAKPDLALRDKNSKTQGEYLLVATGATIKFPSWKKLYKLADEIILPAVTEGQKLDKEKVTALQKFTQGPARYNDASLIKELEKKGIGRPSTYAPTISTIIVRGYVERKQKRFFATQVGSVVTEFLVKNFPKEMEYEFTAKMEADLDEIAEGKQDWQKVLSDFYEPFEKTVVEATGAERIKMPVEHTDKPCPLCTEGEVVIRVGKFGKFYSCSRFPECKYTARFIEYIEGVVCPKDAGRVVVKKTKTGREFFGCENYPNCDYASWTKPKSPEDQT